MFSAIIVAIVEVMLACKAQVYEGTVHEDGPLGMKAAPGYQILKAARECWVSIFAGAAEERLLISQRRIFSQLE